jgi:alkylation response protein AidB-like acyl-CoA dehydrogenase
MTTIGLLPRTKAGRELSTRIEPVLELLRTGAAEHDREASFPNAAFDEFAASGVLGATVPVECGGLGVEDLFDVAVCLSTVATADAGAALALHMQLSRGITVTHDWRRTGSKIWGGLLAAMATGNALVSGAVAEPGRDYEHVATEVSPNSTGSWTLTGHKTFATLSTAATHFVVRARTPDSAREGARFATALVERATDGLTVAGVWDALGMRSSGSADVTFQNCPVESDRLWIRERWGVASEPALVGRAVSSAAMLGIYLGIAERAVELTRKAVGRRRSTTGTGALLADTAARLHALRAVTGYTVDAVGRGTATTVAPVVIMRTFQAGKLFVNEQACLIVDRCMSLVGGAAYTGSHELARLYRDVRAGGFMQPHSPPDALTFLADTTFTGTDGG